MSETRREFLVRVAKGAAYSAPVIRTLTAPEGLRGQANPSQKSGGKAGGKGQGSLSDPATQFQLGPSAPWTNNP